jgi:hypothetical protein
MTTELDAMAEMLRTHGEWFTGGSPGSADEACSAQDWIDYGFTAESAHGWCEIGVWDASTAKRMRDAGLTPAEVRDAAQRLTDGMETWDREDAYTDGDPIYSVCNGDTSVRKIIDECLSVR